MLSAPARMIVACLALCAGCASASRSEPAPLQASIGKASFERPSIAAPGSASVAAQKPRRPRRTWNLTPGVAGRLLSDGSRTLFQRDDTPGWKGPDATAGARPGAAAWNRVGAVEAPKGRPVEPLPPRAPNAGVGSRLFEGFTRGELDPLDCLFDTSSGGRGAAERAARREKLLEDETESGWDDPLEQPSENPLNAWGDYLRSRGREEPIQLDPKKPSRPTTGP